MHICAAWYDPCNITITIDSTWRLFGTRTSVTTMTQIRRHNAGMSPNITLTSQWARWHLKSPASRSFTQPFVQAHIKEHIIAPRHWPLCGEFTGDRWIPRTKASNAENVSIWWRHNGNKVFQKHLSHCPRWSITIHTTKRANPNINIVMPRMLEKSEEKKSLNNYCHAEWVVMHAISW